MTASTAARHSGRGNAHPGDRADLIAFANKIVIQQGNLLDLHMIQTAGRQAVAQPGYCFFFGGGEGVGQGGGGGGGAAYPLL